MRIYHIEKDVEKILNLVKKVLNSKNIIYRNFFNKKTNGEKYYKILKGEKILESIYFLYTSPTIVIGEVYPSYDDAENIVYVGKSIFDIKEENDICLFAQIYHELTHCLDRCYYKKYYIEYNLLKEDYKYFSDLELHSFLHEFYAVKYKLKKDFLKIDTLEKMKKINYCITTTLFHLYSTNQTMYKKYYLPKLFYYLTKNRIKINKRLKYQMLNIEKYVNQIYLE